MKPIVVGPVCLIDYTAVPGFPGGDVEMVH